MGFPFKSTHRVVVKALSAALPKYFHSVRVFERVTPIPQRSLNPDKYGEDWEIGSGGRFDLRNKSDNTPPFQHFFAMHIAIYLAVVQRDADMLVGKPVVKGMR